MYKSFKELIADLCDADRNMDERDLVSLEALDEFYGDQEEE